MSGFAVFVLAIVFLVLCFVIYFLPAFIAGTRKHPNAMPITMLNLMLGWTLLGWVAALIWSLTVSPVAPQMAEAEGERHPCPACGESISIRAHICRFCNRALTSSWADPLILRRRVS